MKKKIKYLGISFLVALFAACTSDNSNDNNSDSLDAQIQEVKNLASSGTWIVASFVDSGVNETDDFAGYSFTFNANGSLIANKGSNTVEGSWSITGDDSSDDSSDDNSSDDDSDDIDFNIFFASPDSFSELSEDWEIVSRSNNRIELIHISGGNGGTDSLVLEKN